MTQQEILAALAENDLKAIRAILNYLYDNSDHDLINEWRQKQDTLRDQLKELQNASAN